MAQLEIKYKDFKLASSWLVDYNPSDPTKYDVVGEASTGSETAIFEYALPSGAQVKSAKVHSVWSPINGYFVTKSINDISVGNDGFVDVTDSFDASATSFRATFKFKSSTTATSTGYKTTETGISDVYLLIEYNTASIVYLGENGTLVPYEVYHGEDGKLVPYMIFHGEDGKLVQY